MRIVSLKVPPVHIVNDGSVGANGTPELVLDCEYEVDPGEKGFVLKWLLDDQHVYQWIPGKKPPQSLSVLKNNIDINYTSSADPLHAHRALAIVRPTLNMTGTYTCYVGSFKSEDKRSAHMLMMRRESQLRVQLEDSRDDRATSRVHCIASDVFPEPELTM